jgi:hypothetical protein
MKKNDWILAVTVAGYSYLFYEQFTGINFLVFNIIVLVSLFFKDNHFLRNKNMWLPFGGALSSAICIAFYGDGLSVFANICSLGILASVFLNAQNSLATAILHAGFSIISAPVYIVGDWVKRWVKHKENGNGKKGLSLLFFSVPIIVSLVFIFFYRNSSILFKNLTDRIRFDFISIGWVFFTIGGLILIYGFYYSRQIQSLRKFEQSQQNHIKQTGISALKFLGYAIDIDTEYKSGLLMLAILNLLILVVNILDMQFLFFGSGFPEGFNYSALVHEGIGSLIMSIITAIAIILWYFKGEQNFMASQTLKILAYIWIAQNVVMIGSTVYKNGLYIEEWALTYKRIGVFIYLLLAGFGLITTAIKIRNVKSNWYLLKVNVAGGFCVLLISCFVNWDLFIARYNIAWSETHNKTEPLEYVSRLSGSVIPDLYQWMKTHPNDPITQRSLERFEDSMLQFKEEQDMVDWRSWSMERRRMMAQWELVETKH